MGLKVSQNKNVSWMDAHVMSFFKKEFRDILQKKEIGDWTTLEKMSLLQCAGVMHSIMAPSFLEVMSPKYFLENYPKGSQTIFDAFGLVKKYSKHMKLKEKELEPLVIFLQALHYQICEKGSKKLDFQYLILVLKFQLYLKTGIHKGILTLDYNSLLRANLIVNEEFIHRSCKMKLSRDTILEDGNIRVVYIITDTQANTSFWTKFQKGLLVKTGLISLFKSFEYGVFHPCIKIGTEFLEWDTSSLIVCQDYDESWSGSYAKAVFRVCDVTVSGEVAEELVDKLNAIIMKWNRNYVYARRNDLENGYANCHLFFSQIRACLNETIPEYKEHQVMKNILGSLNSHTELTIEAIYQYGLTPRFRSVLEKDEQLGLLFQALQEQTSHEAYDRCYRKFKTLFYSRDNKFFPVSFPQDFAVLKAVDRGFWMRRKKAEKRLAVLGGDEMKQSHYKNLYHSKHGIDLGYDCKAMCSFDDATIMTLTKSNIFEQAIRNFKQKNEENGGGGGEGDDDLDAFSNVMEEENDGEDMI